MSLSVELIPDTAATTGSDQTASESPGSPRKLPAAGSGCGEELEIFFKHDCELHTERNPTLFPSPCKIERVLIKYKLMKI